jgi:putative ABC transport system ATP-binding protein
MSSLNPRNMSEQDRSTMTPILQTNRLSKQYHVGDVTVEALRGIDFSVQRGEFVAVMGPSGSGKSTLLHLLGGLDSVSSGEITLDGKPLTQMRDDDMTIMRRREIGFVFQFFNLLPTLTAAENIALPLMMDGRRPADHAERLDVMLALVGLSNQRHHKLSGGQQQRVAIARALIMEPKLILADEPTGNLDSAASETVLKLLRHARDERQQTIIMVTHDWHAAAFADRVVFLKDGGIIDDRVFAEKNIRCTEEIALIMDQLADQEQ